METEPTPIYTHYTDEQLRIKITAMQDHVSLLEQQVEDARAYRDEMIGLLALRGGIDPPSVA